MAEKSYLDSVGDYLKTLNDQGLAVRFGVVFGSWARGTILTSWWFPLVLTAREIAGTWTCSGAWLPE